MRFPVPILALVSALIALESSAQPPHLVIFLSDDHSQIDSSTYGATDLSTPNLDRIARDGMRFAQAFVASPTCAPSRAALLTGLTPALNGAEPNHSEPHADVRKLPAYLQELGYEVVAFGKVAHYRRTKNFGFDFYANDGFHDHGGIPKAVDYLKAHDESKPLCIFVGSNWPHVPWPEDHPEHSPESVNLHPKFVDTPEMREAVAQYHAAVANMDAELGLIYDTAAAELEGETIFLHSSDHGAQLPFHKWNLYDTGIRVPFVAVWPGVIAPGTMSDAMIQWTDILPTLVDLGGGESPQLSGRSFAPVLRGETETHHEVIFTTHSGDKDFNVYPIRSARTKRWKYIRNLHPEFQYATHINRHAERPALIYWNSWLERALEDPAAATVIAHYAERPAEELYDLDSDPDEMVNLAALPAHAETLASLSAQLDAWMLENRDPETVFGTPLVIGDTPALISTQKKKKSPAKK